MVASKLDSHHLRNHQSLIYAEKKFIIIKLDSAIFHEIVKKLFINTILEDFLYGIHFYNTDHRHKLQNWECPNHSGTVITYRTFTNFQ